MPANNTNDPCRAADLNEGVPSRRKRRRTVDLQAVMEYSLTSRHPIRGGSAAHMLATNPFGRNRISSSNPSSTNAPGFSLIETMIGMFILTFGLLVTGQLLFLAMSSSSLARSKGSATIVAQNQLETLADLYRQSAPSSDLTTGNHGPNQVAVTSYDGRTVNRFNVAWTVADVVTNGKTLKAKQVVVTATPIQSTGTTTNSQIGLNKVISLSSILSARMP